ncbi:MAG TPA: hypothetical protein VJO52_15890 [Gemmatimonadaceae bacterium]|nr:hypothetical protein [Gemmatimonadaceae bacterium]
MSTTADSARPTSTVLSRDLSDFVIELSIALHKHAMYPDGHPSLETSRERVLRRLDTLLAERHTLSLGVARDQLIIEGVATDPRHPLLHGLARQLHAHDAGAVKFLAGIEDAEMDQVLRMLARDPLREGRLASPNEVHDVPAWPHVRLFPLSYDQLELLAEGEERGEGDGEPTSGTRQRASQLWLDLARAALQTDESTAPATDPELVAEAINAHEREQAYDQVIIGYLLKIANELASGDRAEAAVLRRRVSRLISALQPEQLRRLVSLGGDTAQRRRFLMDASEGLAVDAALTLVRSAADASERVISTSLLRLFAKLAAHAERGDSSVRAEAERALREQMQQLVSGWVLPDPTPGAYAVVLDRMAPDASLFVSTVESTHACEPLRLVQLSIEVGVIGRETNDAIDAMVKAGQMGTLFSVLGQADADNETAKAIGERLATQEHLRRLLESAAPDAEQLDWVVRRLGARAADPLLDVLGASTSRATRRKVLGLLAQLGPALGPAAVARLSKAPWYFQRNLLILIDRLGAWPSGFSLSPYATHADARVRREAVRMLFKTASASQRDAAILTALGDPDDQVVRVALGAAAEACPPAAIPRIARRVTERELEADLDLLAIKVLAASSDPAALDCLLSCVTTGRGWFGGRRLAPRSPRLLAALAGLVTRWPTDARAASVLARASRHPDPAVRNVVAKWGGSQ